MEKRKKTINIITFIFISIICLMIGYAAITTINLTVSGSAGVSHEGYFNNYYPDEQSGGGIAPAFRIA